MRKINPAVMPKSSVPFKNAVEAFEDAQNEFSEFGAQDTEPTAVFSDALFAVLTNNTPTIPTTARGWQLFSNMPGVGDAVEALTAALRDVVTEALKNNMAIQRYWMNRYGALPY